MLRVIPTASIEECQIWRKVRFPHYPPKLNRVKEVHFLWLSYCGKTWSATKPKILKGKKQSDDRKKPSSLNTTGNTVEARGCGDYT